MQPSEAGVRQLDTLRTFDRLRAAFFRYYETPFGLADPRLERERRVLLDRDGGVYRLPLLELRPEYATTGGSLSDSAEATGAPDELAGFAETGLIPAGRPLYLHQEQALAAGVSPGRHMVITAGTGSGKTEAFLLPVIASLLAESRDWTGEPAGRRFQPWWRSDDDPFAAQRDGETGRAQAVRALVLYPMNALVDDQLTRLRKALDSDAARAWLDNHRRGHRFYFGRYTGATPVTGSPANPLAVRDLRRYLRETERRGVVARQLSRKEGKEGLQYFVPRLDGAEMRSRWDMSAAPPDILITNYSMLNVMLLRERDGHFFDSTRQWLEANPDNRFTLVVDELHTYRGTAGTEVAYLLRALKHRLGLTQRPGQLRVLAASASLDPVRDAAYLQDFFGLPAEDFEFIGGHTIQSGRADPIGAVNIAELATADAATAADIVRRHGLGDVLRRSFDEAVDGATVAVTRSAADIAARLFPDADCETAQAALGRVVTGLASYPAPGDPRLRTHMFFRNVPGVWACSDPQCSYIPGGVYADRTVGQLYVEPTTRCTCGARVLELLYCQTCGDVMLGGFTPEGATQRPRVDALLLADIPDLARLPDQVRLERTADNYLVFWPRAAATLTELDHHVWRSDGGAVTYTFRRSRLDPGKGGLRNVSADHTGWSFHVTVARTRGGELRRDPASLSPYPTQCPACGDDWKITYGPAGPLPPTDPRRQRSPIRGMRTGFEKINQVLTTELATDLGEQDRKIILFTDSRQDAAKMSSGLGLRHYQDLLRLLLYSQLQRRGDPAADVTLARAHIQGQRNERTWAAVHRLQDRDRSGFDQLRDVWEGAPGTRLEDEPALAARLARAPTIAELSGVIAGELLAMGMNPGGPHASLQQTSDRRDAASWTTLYDWQAKPPRPRGGLSLNQQRLQINIDESLLHELLEGLFSGAGRDFESLGLGWLALADDQEPADVSPNSATGHARAALRVLAGQRRFDGLRDGRGDPPRKLRKLWSAVEDAGGPDRAALADIVAGRWAAAVRDYIIDPSRVSLRLPTAVAWICVGCRRQHLNRGCGRCTHCRRTLPEHPTAAQSENNYYSWKATTGDGRFRLHCAELTGQTDRLDAQSRQSRFQGVFLDRDESELADGVDLLSVTTTMEAGVDIGALSAVVLGNMPPTRFNYQQRVGRAGRREAPVAIALTVCRGRSHDEYYFDRPTAITNEPTPKPYLALNRAEIYHRSLRSEVLRLAMRDIGPSLIAHGIDIDLTANVHGAFGRVTDWPVLRTALDDWLNRNRKAIGDVAMSLADGTPLAASAAEAAVECSADLVPRIDEAVAAAAGHAELSQRLAEHGVLPMFGFPSSVRYLHLRRPRYSYPWPPSAVVDRDLAMAVGQFAPLSEVVRDGRVHPVVGIAAFVPVRPTPLPESDPLGPQRAISICRMCSYLDEDAGATAPADAHGACPQCGAGPDSYASMLLREPLGFRAGFHHDFDGNFAWSARAMAARALTNLDALTAVPTGGAVCYSGPGRRFVINDNGGKLFAFRSAAARTQDWGGYVSVSAIERGLLEPSAATGDAFSVAIGAVQPTDFFFLGPTHATDPSVGIRLNLAGGRQPSGARETTDGRRGAWYSLAFLLRTVAASYLDVQPLELTAGIYAGLAGAEPATYAFIADTLENGAGFSSHLGDASVLPDLLCRVDAYLSELADPDHAGDCAASCYRCLRDYGNMAYHALLDWRLARDLFAMLRGKGLTVDSAADSRALHRWAASYGATNIDDLPAPAAVFEHPLRGRHIVVARHPFEASEQTLIAPRLAKSCALAAAATPDAVSTVFVDTFTLDRDPRRVIEMCDEAEPGP